MAALSNLIGQLALWTSLSFLAHFFAKTSLSKVSASLWAGAGPSSSNSPDLLWYAAIIITFFQLVFGLFIVFLDKFFSKVVYQQPFQRYLDSPESKSSIGSITLCHVFATLCTNLSLASSNASFTFTIKAFEPLSTTVLASILSNKRLATNHLISLPLVAFGAVGFVWKPYSTNLDIMAIVFAFSSNILFGLRNIGLKDRKMSLAVYHFKTSNDDSKASNQESSPAMVHKNFPDGRFSIELDSLQILGHISLISTLILFPALLIDYVFGGGISYISSLRNVSFFDIELGLSSIFHVTYTVVSTCFVLTSVSTVDHSTLNLLKRVAIATIFYIQGQPGFTGVNIGAAILIIVGLLIYKDYHLHFCKIDDSKTTQKLSLAIIMSAFILLITCFQPSSKATSTVGIRHESLRQNLHSNSISLYKTPLTLKEQANLDVDLFRSPERADFLSKRLRYAPDVVHEARRIHDQVFQRLIGPYTYAVLVNIFTWVNKGDQLITIGERLLLKRFNVSLTYYCFYPGDECNFEHIPRTPDTVILIQGAGYIGHPAHVDVVSKTIRSFPDNKIVVFPISVCYPTTECNDIKSYVNLFKSHKDVNICLRDRVSFDKARHFFTTSNNFLTPDSAFAVGPIHINMLPSYDIVWIKRNDWENYGDAYHDELPPIPATIKYVIADWNDKWMDPGTEVNGDNFFEMHQLQAWSGLLYIARAKVVITDRLHAHLMCTLMDKPNVVQNSRTKKQQNYYDTWERNIENSYVVNSANEALEKAFLLLKKYY